MHDCIHNIEDVDIKEPDNDKRKITTSIVDVNQDPEDSE